MESEIEYFEKIKENINKIIDANKAFLRSNGQALIGLSKEEFIIWKRNNGVSAPEGLIYCTQGGEKTHYFHRNYTNSKYQIGIYTPRKGYYYITEIPSTPIFANSGISIENNSKSKSADLLMTTNGDSRIIEKPIYAKYDSEESENFIDEVVLIETKFLYNFHSHGPKKLELEEGMILEIYEPTDLLNDAYAIHWRVLDGENGCPIQEDYDNEKKSYSEYRGSYVQDYEGWSDDNINDVFDGNPDAYWNID